MTFHSPPNPPEKERLMMHHQSISPTVQMAVDAAAHMTEEQRLAFAIQLIIEASSTHSVQQLRRAATAATVSADDLERSRGLVEALRQRDGDYTIHSGDGLMGVA